jgi:hypothetical protein
MDMWLCVLAKNEWNDSENFWFLTLWLPDFFWHSRSNQVAIFVDEMRGLCAYYAILHYKACVVVYYAQEHEVIISGCAQN